MIWKPKRFKLCAAVLLLFAVAGCNDGRPQRVPVSGQVLIDGQPLTHGSVRFMPTGARASYGTLDANGRFSLKCYEANDGAVLGSHVVVVDASEVISSKLIRWHAPRKYAETDTSGKSIDITGPTDALVVELSWKDSPPGHPFDEPRH